MIDPIKERLITNILIVFNSEGFGDLEEFTKEMLQDKSIPELHEFLKSGVTGTVKRECIPKFIQKYPNKILNIPG
jgi:hypothetical protein